MGAVITHYEGGVMAELSEEEQKVLEKLHRDAERAAQIPASERHMITNPEKYSTPLGVDDEGRPFSGEEHKHSHKRHKGNK